MLKEVKGTGKRFHLADLFQLLLFLSSESEICGFIQRERERERVIQSRSKMRRPTRINEGWSETQLLSVMHDGRGKGTSNNGNPCTCMHGLLYVPAEARNGGASIATNLQELPTERAGAVAPMVCGGANGVRLNASPNGYPLGGR